ncbi:MAG: amino acid permease [Candidatus Tokpelaia sp.]|nr:MAG: amino acid permease [Candidatus Tokpelaia sp.]KAA6206849.1 MAG: amino acid permease [Candidatus Tokpelaia sp.]
MADKLRRKTIEEMRAHSAARSLVPSLGWPHLVALGVGAVVGSGIYILIGAAADKAGPAVLLAFIISGLVCACAAFAYAELATMIPISGGAYTYAYTACGEIVGWLVGWSTIFGFLLSVCFVAVGWASYCTPYLTVFLQDYGINLPYWLLHSYGTVDTDTGAQGFVNLPAVAIIVIIAGLLLVGTKESVLVNSALVVMKIAALLIFALIALPHFQSANFSPFMPYGFVKHIGADGVERGVMAAAAMVFLAFYGFDTVATAAEETRNPERNLSIGIIGSLGVVVIIYMLVCLAALGAVNYTVFAREGDVLSFVLRQVGSNRAAGLVALVAVMALPTVILALFYALTRLLFTIGRDGLLPARFAHMSKKGTPIATTLITAIIAAAVSGFLPFDKIVVYANAGPLFLFASVGLSLLILRKREAQAARGFKAPCAGLVGLTAILGCVYLFWNLPGRTQFGFLIWNLAGLAVYFAYGRRKSTFAGKKA